MAEYKTKYAIGDLVYVATRNDVDRLVVDAVKVKGAKEEVEYGFKNSNIGYDSISVIYFGPRNEYTWRSASELSEDKESAVARHENLKTEYEANQAKEKAKRDKERRTHLLEQLEALDNGQDVDEY